MSFNCGIIGLPNVGKSTIFNALTGAGAQMANYPFCTIEPNKGIVQIPDERLYKIAAILKKDNPIPTRIEFIDVAGLVEGASKGEGLGNKFLGHIRTVDAVIHVVRCFDIGEVVHVTDSIDPIHDIETINTELMLADMEVLERARDKLIKLERSGDKKSKKKIELLERLIAHLNSGKLLRGMGIKDDEREMILEYGLITLKPVLYLANISEDDPGKEQMKKVKEHAVNEGSEYLFIVGKLEEEITELPLSERQEYLGAMGLEESGLNRLIQASYRLLRLITFYSSATDLQAWTIKRGTCAQKAAGKIHTDFERGFIRAEVYSFDNLLASGSEHGIRESGLLRSEGKEYIVKDGDIIKFLFNV